MAIVAVNIPGPCNSVGVHVKSPVGEILIPSSIAAASKVKVNVLERTSGSIAVAVNASVDNSLMD